MILKDLISLSTDCAREAVNDCHLHFDNGVDDIKNEVGCMLIERTSNLLGFDPSLVFSQVNSRLRNFIREGHWWGLT